MTTSCEKYEFDFSELRGRIKARIGSEGEFADKIERSPQFVSSVFNGKSLFDTTDIVKASELLDIPSNMIGFFFYTYKVRNCEQKGE